MEWIDVSTKLPADNTEVLVVIYADGSRYIEIAIHDDRDNAWSHTGDFDEIADITHWMPMPELPA
jgi:hypothetical protein